jgi:hypothetical protein
VCRLDHLVCSIQNPNFVCMRFILWARSVCCLLVHMFLLVLRFACRFNVVLGTARTTQIGGGVIVAKAQRSPCGVVVGQHNVDPPQIELSPTLIKRSGANPQRVPSCGNQSKVFFGERFYQSLYLQSRKLHKNRLDLKIPTTSLSFCCSA